MRALAAPLVALLVLVLHSAAIAEQLIADGQIEGLKISQCTAIAPSPDGASIAALNNGELALWDGTGKTLRARVAITSAQGAQGLAFSPDGKQVAVGLTGSIGLYTIERLELADSIPLPGNGTVQTLTYSPDGKLLAVSHGGEDGDFRIDGDSVFEVATKRRIKLLAKAHNSERLTMGMAFSPDGKWLALAVAGKQKGVELYATSDWKRRAALAYPADATKVAFFADGQQLATGAIDRKIRIHTVGDKLPITKQWVAHTGTRNDDRGYISGLAASADGALLVSASDDDRGLRVWNARSGQELASAHHEVSRVGGFALLPDGKTVLVGGYSFRRLQRFELVR